MKNLVCFFLIILPFLSIARAENKTQTLDFDLDALRWQKRVLLLFGPSKSEASLLTQKQDLASRFQEVVDRDIITLEILENGESRAGDRVLSKNAVESIRRRLGVRSGAFQLILIGKDGAVKLRSDKPVAAQDIFKIIDSMPMRRQEMEGERKPSS